MTSHRIDQLDAVLRELNQEYSTLVSLEMSMPGDTLILARIARNWRDWQETREQLQREREAFLSGERERKREREAS